LSLFTFAAGEAYLEFAVSTVRYTYPEGKGTAPQQVSRADTVTRDLSAPHYCV